MLSIQKDGYVNEAWFGLNRAIDCGDHVGEGASAKHHLTALSPRPVIAALTAVYSGPGGADAAQPTCAELRPCWQCVTAHSATEVAAGACNDICKLQLGGTITPPPGNGNSTGNDGSSGSGNGGSSGTNGGGGKGSSTGTNTAPSSTGSSDGPDNGDGNVTPAAASSIGVDAATLLLALLGASLALAIF